MTGHFADAQHERKPSGYIIIDGQEVAHTLQCAHCNTHFVSVKGSGRKRGYCMRCKKITCGKAVCDVCIPFQAKLDLYDGGNTTATAKLFQKFKEEITILSQKGVPLI